MASKTKEKNIFSKKNLQIVEKLAKELLSLMGTKAKVNVSEDKQNQTVKVDLDTDSETGLLIGNRGETISAIQVVLGMIIRQEVGEWIRIVVDVGDWREKQEEQLRELAQQAAERVKQTGEPQSLYNLNPNQRRIIHLVLSDDSDIETQSVGEDADRYLVVDLKSSGKKK